MDEDVTPLQHQILKANNYFIINSINDILTFRDKMPISKRTNQMTEKSIALNQPLWIINGLKDLGFHEKGDNRGIEKFIELARAGQLGDPWCAIWANAKLEQSNVPGTRSASSQSFRHDENKFIQLEGPTLGAIAVYWRGSRSSGLGHVGFYMGETATQVLTLGGNESDAVRKQFEPKARLYGYWWPKGQPKPKIGAIKVKDVDGHPVGSVT